MTVTVLFCEALLALADTDPEETIELCDAAEELTRAAELDAVPEVMLEELVAKILLELTGTEEATDDDVSDVDEPFDAPAAFWAAKPAMVDPFFFADAPLHTS